MIVLICGDRNWKDKDFIKNIVSSIDPLPTRIIIGDAKGVDEMGGQVAKELSIEIDGPYKAQWSKYGRSAGPIRNSEMLAKGMPDLILAFHDNIGVSKGTADMVNKASIAQIPVKLYCHKEDW